MKNHSFAIVVYKDSPYLEECIKALLCQTVKSEIYICTSTPSSYITAIAAQFGLPVFINPESRGIAHDWNFSLKQAKTKYVTLAHQDDIYKPAYTEKCIMLAEKHDDTLICFTDYCEMLNDLPRENTNLLRIKKLLLWLFMPFKKNIKSKFWKKTFLSFGTPIPCPSVMYNIKLLSDFHFSENYLVSLDWDAWLRMAEMNGRFVYVTDNLFIHRIHKKSATTEAISANARYQEDFKIYNRIWPKILAMLLSKLYSLSHKFNKTE